MHKLPTIENVDLSGKKVLVREDLNVPIENGLVVSDARIKAAVLNLRSILSKNPKQIIILSHLGRPIPGADNSKFSLYPVI
jgi:phosphoglycerate kinase